MVTRVVVVKVVDTGLSVVVPHVVFIVVVFCDVCFVIYMGKYTFRLAYAVPTRFIIPFMSNDGGVIPPKSKPAGVIAVVLGSVEINVMQLSCKKTYF